ncbi:unnamed protein product [Spodoptera exigua]|nr:unnamed protein product [Spodoptera exigua]
MGLNRAGSEQEKERDAWGESLLSLPKRWLSTQVYGSDDEDYQNVQLPKLPVPELETTMESYLEFASVVVSQQALEHSRGLVRGFMEELGPRLQETLTDRQKEMDNWCTHDAPIPFNASNDVHNKTNLLQHYRNTITKIKKLVKLYEIKLNDTKDLDILVGPYKDSRNAFNKESTTEDRTDKEDRSSHKESNSNKLVLNSNDTTQLVEVTKAIVLLSDFVSKQTTQHYLQTVAVNQTNIDKVNTAQPLTSNELKNAGLVQSNGTYIFKEVNQESTGLYNTKDKYPTTSTNPSPNHKPRNITNNDTMFSTDAVKVTPFFKPNRTSNSKDLLETVDATVAMIVKKQEPTIASNLEGTTAFKNTNKDSTLKVAEAIDNNKSASLDFAETKSLSNTLNYSVTPITTHYDENVVSAQINNQSSIYSNTDITTYPNILNNQIYEAETTTYDNSSPLIGIHADSTIDDVNKETLLTDITPLFAYYEMTNTSTPLSMYANDELESVILGNMTTPELISDDKAINSTKPLSKTDNLHSFDVDAVDKRTFTYTVEKISEHTSDYEMDTTSQIPTDLINTKSSVNYIEDVTLGKIVNKTTVLDNDSNLSPAELNSTESYKIVIDSTIQHENEYETMGLSSPIQDAITSEPPIMVIEDTTFSHPFNLTSAHEHGSYDKIMNLTLPETNTKNTEVSVSDVTRNKIPAITTEGSADKTTNVTSQPSINFTAKEFSTDDDKDTTILSETFITTQTIEHVSDGEATTTPTNDLTIINSPVVDNTDKTTHEDVFNFITPSNDEIMDFALPFNTDVYFTPDSFVQNDDLVDKDLMLDRNNYTDDTDIENITENINTLWVLPNETQPVIGYSTSKTTNFTDGATSYEYKPNITNTSPKVIVSFEANKNPKMDIEIEEKTVLNPENNTEIHPTSIALNTNIGKEEKETIPIYSNYVMATKDTTDFDYATPNKPSTVSTINDVLIKHETVTLDTKVTDTHFKNTDMGLISTELVPTTSDDNKSTFDKKEINETRDKVMVTSTRNIQEFNKNITENDNSYIKTVNYAIEDQTDRAQISAVTENNVLEIGNQNIKTNHLETPLTTEEFIVQYTNSTQSSENNKGIVKNNTSHTTSDVPDLLVASSLGNTDDTTNIKNVVTKSQPDKNQISAVTENNLLEIGNQNITINHSETPLTTEELVTHYVTLLSDNDIRIIKNNNSPTMSSVPNLLVTTSLDNTNNIANSKITSFNFRVPSTKSIAQEENIFGSSSPTLKNEDNFDIHSSEIKETTFLDIMTETKTDLTEAVETSTISPIQKITTETEIIQDAVDTENINQLQFIQDSVDFTTQENITSLNFNTTNLQKSTKSLLFDNFMETSENNFELKRQDVKEITTSQYILKSNETRDLNVTQAVPFTKDTTNFIEADISEEISTTKRSLEINNLSTTQFLTNKTARDISREYESELLESGKLSTKLMSIDSDEIMLLPNKKKDEGTSTSPNVLSTSTESYTTMFVNYTSNSVLDFNNNFNDVETSITKPVYNLSSITPNEEMEFSYQNETKNKNYQTDALAQISNKVSDRESSTLQETETKEINLISSDNHYIETLQNSKGLTTELLSSQKQLSAINLDQSLTSAMTTSSSSFQNLAHSTLPTKGNSTAIKTSFIKKTENTMNIFENHGTTNILQLEKSKKKNVFDPQANDDFITYGPPLHKKNDGLLINDVTNNILETTRTFDNANSTNNLLIDNHSINITKEDIKTAIKTPTALTVSKVTDIKDLHMKHLTATSKLSDNEFFETSSNIFENLKKPSIETTHYVPVQFESAYDTTISTIDKSNSGASPSFETTFYNTKTETTPTNELNLYASESNDYKTNTPRIEKLSTKSNNITVKEHSKRLKKAKVKNILKRPVAFELNIRVGVEASKDGIKFTVLGSNETAKNLLTSQKHQQSSANNSDKKTTKTMKTNKNNSKEATLKSKIKLDNDTHKSKISLNNQLKDIVWINMHRNRKSNYDQNADLTRISTILNKLSWNPLPTINTNYTESINNLSITQNAHVMKPPGVNLTTAYINTTMNETSPVVSSNATSGTHESKKPDALSQTPAINNIKSIYIKYLQKIKDSMAFNKDKNITAADILSKMYDAMKMHPMGQIEIQNRLKLNKTQTNNTLHNNDHISNLNTTKRFHNKHDTIDKASKLRKKKKKILKSRRKKVAAALTKLLKGKKLTKKQLRKLTKKILKKNFPRISDIRMHNMSSKTNNSISNDTAATSNNVTLLSGNVTRSVVNITSLYLNKESSNIKNSLTNVTNLTKGNIALEDYRQEIKILNKTGLNVLSERKVNNSIRDDVSKFKSSKINSSHQYTFREKESYKDSKGIEKIFRTNTTLPTIEHEKLLKVTKNYVSEFQAAAFRNNSQEKISTFVLDDTKSPSYKSITMATNDGKESTNIVTGMLTVDIDTIDDLIHKQNGFNHSTVAYNDDNFIAKDQKPTEDIHNGFSEYTAPIPAGQKSTSETTISNKTDYLNKFPVHNFELRTEIELHENVHQNYTTTKLQLDKNLAIAENESIDKANPSVLDEISEIKEIGCNLTTNATTDEFLRYKCSNVNISTLQAMNKILITSPTTDTYKPTTVSAEDISQQYVLRTNSPEKSTNQIYRKKNYFSNNESFMMISTDLKDRNVINTTDTSNTEDHRSITEKVITTQEAVSDTTKITLSNQYNEDNSVNLRKYLTTEGKQNTSTSKIVEVNATRKQTIKSEEKSMQLKSMNFKTNTESLKSTGKTSRDNNVLYGTVSIKELRTKTKLNKINEVSTIPYSKALYIVNDENKKELNSKKVTDAFIKRNSSSNKSKVMSPLSYSTNKLITLKPFTTKEDRVNEHRSSVHENEETTTYSPLVQDVINVPHIVKGQLETTTIKIRGKIFSDNKEFVSKIYTRHPPPTKTTFHKILHVPDDLTKQLRNGDNHSKIVASTEHDLILEKEHHPTVDVNTNIRIEINGAQKKNRTFQVYRETYSPLYVNKETEHPVTPQLKSISYVLDQNQRQTVLNRTNDDKYSIKNLASTDTYNLSNLLTSNSTSKTTNIMERNHKTTAYIERYVIGDTTLKYKEFEKPFNPEHGSLKTTTPYKHNKLQKRFQVKSNNNKLRPFDVVNNNVKNISLNQTNLTNEKVTIMKLYNSTGHDVKYNDNQHYPVPFSEIRFRSEQTNHNDTLRIGNRNNNKNNNGRLSPSMNFEPTKGIKEANIQIYSSHLQTPRISVTTSTPTTKMIKYNTYRPTTKEDLELLKYQDGITIVKTPVNNPSNKVNTQEPSLNNSCAILKNISDKFSSKTEFIKILEAANCTQPRRLSFTENNHMAEERNKNTLQPIEIIKIPHSAEIDNNHHPILEININSPQIGTNGGSPPMIEINGNPLPMEIHGHSLPLDGLGSSPQANNYASNLASINQNVPFENGPHTIVDPMQTIQDPTPQNIYRNSPGLEIDKNSLPRLIHTYSKENNGNTLMMEKSESPQNIGNLQPMINDKTMITSSTSELQQNSTNRQTSPVFSSVHKYFPESLNDPSFVSTNIENSDAISENERYFIPMANNNFNSPLQPTYTEGDSPTIVENNWSPTIVSKINKNTLSMINTNINSQTVVDNNRNSPTNAINGNLPAAQVTNNGNSISNKSSVTPGLDKAPSMVDYNKNSLPQNNPDLQFIENIRKSQSVFDTKLNSEILVNKNRNSVQPQNRIKTPKTTDIYWNSRVKNKDKQTTAINAISTQIMPTLTDKNRSSPLFDDKNLFTFIYKNKKPSPVDSRKDKPPTRTTKNNNKHPRPLLNLYENARKVINKKLVRNREDRVISHPMIETNVISMPILDTRRSASAAAPANMPFVSLHNVKKSLPISRNDRKGHPTSEINRNSHLTGGLQKNKPKFGSLLDPFGRKNPYPLKLLPVKSLKTPMKRVRLGNRRMPVMTMNTQDFFSQHRYVTAKPPPLIFKALKSGPDFSLLRPVFRNIDKSSTRFDRRRIPVHLKPKDYVVQPVDDDERWYKKEPAEQRVKQAEGLTTKVKENNNMPSVRRPTVRPSFLKNRVKSIKKRLFTGDYHRVTRQPAYDEVLDEPEEPEKDNYSPAPFYHRRDHNDQVTDWWLDDMYLKVRLPLPINSNPGMVFPRRHFAKMEEVADLGALFIDDLLDYKEMLDRGELPLERATSREKGQPLCMEQFYRLLGVCRIPEVGKDRLELPPVRQGSEESEELIVVACRNYFYPIPVKAADRGRLTPGEIQAQLLHAMVDAAGAPPAPRVGLLTSMNRDQWAKAREQLIRDEMNRMNLELISRALCILCLDEAGGDRADTDADTNAMLRAMHGAGTRHHSANRWFDKTVQLIISSDGTIGMCYEHSAAEGVAVVRLAERALARAEVADRPAPPPALLPAPQAMKWNVPPDVQRTIETAARDLDRAISDLDHKVYTYRGYGREFMKSCRTSPDVYIQLALQYAYYKMYGYLVTTYESASLRRFRNGRVDNIRSAHGAALAWAAAMCTAETPPLNDGSDEGQKKVSFNLYGEQKKLELFEEAARKQTSIMEANILGKGIDNHLLGLREAARESLGELPPVFCDTTYKQMIEFKLSTSQVATTTDGTFMGYGAVCPDGYGCSYNPKKDSIIFCISSFTSSSVTNTEAFRQSLEEALDSMKLMFQARKVDN